MKHQSKKMTNYRWPGARATVISLVDFNRVVLGYVHDEMKLSKTTNQVYCEQGTVIISC